MDLREDDARYYRDYIERTHWLKLRSFRRALERSGADLAELDGSSESLIPLWQWVRAGLEVDFSFLLEEGPSSSFQALGFQWDLPMARRTLVNEWIVNYLFEQLRSIDPATAWAFKERQGKGPQESTTYQTVIRSRNPEVKTHTLCLGMFEMAQRGVPIWSGDDALQRWATTWAFGGSLPQPTSPTSLQRAVDVPGVDAPPRLLRAADAPEPIDVTLNGRYYIAQWADGSADLGTATPLRARDVAEVLDREGFLNASNEQCPLSPADIAAEAQAVSPEREILIDPFSIAGDLRALEVRVFASGEDALFAHVQLLNALASELNARMVPKDLLD